MYEDVVKELRNLLRAYKATDNGNCHQAKILANAADAIEELTNRNVGKWEVDEVGCAICSVCRNYAFETITHHISGWYPRFCPHCGAKMEEDKFDDNPPMEYFESGGK